MVLLSDDKNRYEKNETVIPVQCPACGKDIEFKFEHYHKTTSTSELIFIKEKEKE